MSVITMFTVSMIIVH